MRMSEKFEVSLNVIGCTKGKEMIDCEMRGGWRGGRGEFLG